ncbi:MAG: hypothetical protein HY516_01435 [Candidatus Aenigmarchaeota archaeon]|nr:hypothetical protein [Candidatus Aenigmarchaeota archaeon]
MTIQTGFEGSLFLWCVYAAMERRKEIFDLLNGAGLKQVHWREDSEDPAFNSRP